MKKKKETIMKPSRSYEYLVSCGVDEQVALEADELEQIKSKRRKRLADKIREGNEKWK